MSRILVVDDEKNVRRSVAITLRREGHDVETAATGETAVEIASGSPFDLVLTDIRLDEMSGMDVLRAIKSDRSETEVVMMTAFATIENAVEVMRLGAQDYLCKPFEAEEVIRVVDSALATQKLSSEMVGRAKSFDANVFAGIIGKSEALSEVLRLVTKIAGTNSSVLISGETGTGKELIGRAIHRGSHRSGQNFCAINSAAFPETLLESELFGHRRGSFTGATSNKRGLFEHADRGTIFLDEVAEMPLSMQAKLLRFLQTGELRPVGGESSHVVDVRVIAATNKILEKEVSEGRFREDLYYRLAVIPIHVPPLRERPEDILMLAESFLRRYTEKRDLQINGIDEQAAQLLVNYAWPGNVRELENMIERGVALGRGGCLRREDFPSRLAEQEHYEERKSIQSLHALEREHILSTLDKVGWNRKRAAELLEISTTTLWRRLKEFGIERDGNRQSVNLPHATSAPR